MSARCKSVSLPAPICIFFRDNDVSQNTRVSRYRHEALVASGLTTVVTGHQLSVAVTICMLFRSNDISQPAAAELAWPALGFLAVGRGGRDNMAEWIDQLLVEQKLAPRTIAQYAAGLLYWDMWHRLRYGMPLSLSAAPPTAVSLDAVNAFIDDHLAIAVGGRLRMRMTSTIFDGLREAGYNARVDCVAPATSDWRLLVLQRAHSLSNLRFDRELVRRRKPEIYASWEAERAALGITMALPMSATNTVSALLGVCNDDREGTMDVALILFLCRLTPSQVAQLRFSELAPGTIVLDGEELDAVELTIRDPIGELQTSQPKIRFVGDEATLIKAWGALREDEVIQGREDWFFARKARRNASPALDNVWIARRIRLLAQHAGLADASGRSRVSPQWLRKAYEREWREHSDLVKAARAARVGTRTILRMTRQART